MDEKIDHGPIINQSKISIDKPNYKELFKLLVDESKSLIIETIPKWLNNNIKAKKQDHSKATYTSLLKKEDGKINWENKAIKIERKVRAFNPWPSVFTYFDKKLLKVLEAEVLKQNDFSKEKPGKVLSYGKDKLVVQTGEELLRLKKIQVEGKKAMKDTAFLKGNKEIIGKLLN